jgi:hypothetical protein
MNELTNHFYRRRRRHEAAACDLPNTTTSTYADAVRTDDDSVLFYGAFLIIAFVGSTAHNYICTLKFIRARLLSLNSVQIKL